MMLFFLLSSLFAAELMLDDPNYLPPKGAASLEIRSSTMHEEIEYEANSVRIDQENYKYNLYELRGLITPVERMTFGFLGGYDFDREYEVHFGPESSRANDPPFLGHARGFTDPELIFAYNFEPVSENWVQQFYFQFNPFDVEEAPNRIYRGGHDFFLEYRFGHADSYGQMHGKIYSHYFGKKNFYIPGDNRPSVTEPYTEVGLEIGYTYRFFSPYIIRASVEFGQSSDYVVRTPELNRSADKGTIIGAEVDFAKYFGQQTLLGFNFKTITRVYNANNEQLSRNIDYEIEKQSFQIFLRFEGGPWW